MHGVDRIFADYPFDRRSVRSLSVQDLNALEIKPAEIDHLAAAASRL